jgi:hypothetical protein
MTALAQLRKYGPTAIGTYLSISFCTWLCLFNALENKLDLESVFSYVWGEGVSTKEVLARWGLKPKDPDAPKSVWDTIPSAVLALLISKAFVPIKVPIALGLTPYVHRVLAARGFIKRAKQ